MVKRSASIAVILGLLPLLGVACGEETWPTPTLSPAVNPTQSPSAGLRDDPPDGWAVHRNEE